MWRMGQFGITTGLLFALLGDMPLSQIEGGNAAGCENGVLRSTELSEDTYLITTFRTPSDEPELPATVHFCPTKSGHVDALLMQSVRIRSMHVLYLQREGENCIPKLLQVAEVVPCQGPE